MNMVGRLHSIRPTISILAELAIDESEYHGGNCSRMTTPFMRVLSEKVQHYIKGLLRQIDEAMVAEFMENVQAKV